MSLNLLTPESAAPLLACTPATVEDRLRDGTLPGVQIGRAWLIPASALHERLHELALAQAAERRQRAEARPSPTTPFRHGELVPCGPDLKPLRRRAPPELTP